MRTYRVGIYIPGLASGYGGAERFAATIGQYISDAYDEVSLSFVVYGKTGSRPSIDAVNEKYSLSLPSDAEVTVLDDDWGPSPLATAAGHRRLRATSRDKDLFINCFHNVHFFEAARNVHIIHFPARPRREASPTFAGSAPGRLIGSLLDRRYLESYDLFVCNSRFTRAWLEEYWHPDPGRIEVLYPPVPPLAAPEAAMVQTRARRIAMCSRFDPRKRIAEAVDAFAASAARLPGWELAVAGSVGGSERARSCLAEARAAGKGAPVSFYPDLDPRALAELFRGSRLYWNAMGDGVDERTAPIDVEHFGIATVEAMSAGLVPVVVDKGGQREVIADGIDGFLCGSIGEIAERSVSLGADPPAIERISAAAAAKSAEFGLGRFYERLDALFSARSLIPAAYRKGSAHG